jgi:beta-glucosidase
MEGSGEDPYLTSVVGVAKIKRISKETILLETYTAKHFTGWICRGGRVQHGGEENELHNAVLHSF